MTTYTTDPVYFLLVDDLEENLISLEALLRRDGLILLKAKSGNEALELLLKHEVALALLDVQMPGMDGFELAEMMRGTQKTRRIPIIFLTAGAADRSRRFRGYEAGAVDFIYKPIEPDILKSKTDVFFSLYKQQQQLEAQRDAIQVNAAVLQEADHRKDEFLATLAHELRNPLAPIRNGIEIIRNGRDQKVADETVAMMDRQLTHLVRLIDDLLDVSRISKGKIDLRLEKMRLQDAVQAAIEASRPYIVEVCHTLTLDMPEDSLWIEADATRVTQSVTNLINNAAKYTPPGGKIHVAVRSENGNAIIDVRDNGIGIQADMLPKVFDLFTQVEHDMKHAQGGLGIGLALVKRLVEMHGGKITAKSDGRGKGSVFTIELSLVDAPAGAVAGTPSAAAGAQAVEKLKILVVDDNVPAAQTMFWMLEMMGHELVMAHEGAGAIEKARQLHPDVILLDIGMPGMSGYDVARELRKDPQFKDTVLIAQTGWGQERDRQQAFDAGFNHHLVKPVSMEQFAKILPGIKAARK